MAIPNNFPIEQELSSQRSGFPTFFPWNQIQGNFGIEPGKVFIDDFDLGVIKTLGAFLDPKSPVDEPSFVLKVPGLKLDEQREAGLIEEDVVPVTFGHPEAYMSVWKLPGIFVRREGVEPDLSRYSQELEAFRGPAPNTKIVDGVVLSIDPEGPKEVIQRQRAEAYNFLYIIDIIARYRTDANALLRTVLPRYKQHRAVIVRDSKGDLNEYTAFLESVDDLQEIIGVTMKHVGYSLTIRVIGELDLFDNVVIPTATRIESEIVVKKPGTVTPAKTAPDGLPLKTQPANALSLLCSMTARVR